MRVYSSFFYPFHTADLSLVRSCLDKSSTWTEERPSLDSSLYPYIRRLFRQGEYADEGFTLISNPESPQFKRLRAGAHFNLPRIGEERLRSIIAKIGLGPDEEIPAVSISFTSARVHGFSTGMGIINLEAEYSVEGTGEAHDEVYQHLVLEVLGSITHTALTMKGRLKFDPTKPPVSLTQVFEELCSDLVNKSRSEIECVRIPSYSLIITDAEQEYRNELRVFSHKIARRHTSAYQTVVQDEHRISTYSNIEFASTFEGSSLWIETSDQSSEFFKQFRASTWRTAYLPIHMLILHEYFYLRYLQDALSRRAQDLQKAGDGWFSSKSSYCEKEDEELLSEMRNYLLRFRSHNISSLQHHNDVYQKGRNVLGLPQTLAVIESDFQAIQAERAIQVQREAVLMNKTIRVVGYIVATLIAAAGVVSGVNDSLELAKKLEQPISASEEKK